MKAGKIWGETKLIHANNSFEFHRIQFKANYKCSKDHYENRKFDRL